MSDSLSSDAEYAEKLQYQEALMADLLFDHNNHSNDVSTSSSSIPLYCEICLENQQNQIKIETCNHSFCSDCIAQHAEIKVNEKLSIVTCPGLNCRAIIQPTVWLPVLSKDTADKYYEILCELSIPDSHKLYCPFKECSAVLEFDDSELMVETECMECRRLFCGVCRVPWHTGVTCEEFQNLPEDERESEDIRLMLLAKDNDWARCSSCNMFVEKNEGCQHITCRCGAEWCYVCGEKWNESHYNCRPPES